MTLRRIWFWAYTCLLFGCNSGLSKDISQIQRPPDRVQEPELASLLGLKLALEKQQNELPQFMLGPRTTKPANHRSSHVGESTFQPEVRIQVQMSGNRWAVICEVESMQLNHNVHLVCPLMQPRCFENCKRICEPSGCVQEPSLRDVTCTARQTEPTAMGGFVRRFEYQVDQYDQNITGSWYCFFAGMESDKVYLIAEPPTTTTPTTTTTTTTTATTGTTATPASLGTTRATPKTSKLTVPNAVSVDANTSVKSKGITMVGQNAAEISQHKQFYQTDYGASEKRVYSSNNLTLAIQNARPNHASGKQAANKTYHPDDLLNNLNNRPNSRSHSFTNFISSNVHVVLGFMALLALSLLTNLVFCLQFLRMTRNHVKHESSQSQFSPSQLAVHGMNNSTAGSLKAVRPREPVLGVCRPVSWLSPVASIQNSSKKSKSSGCSVTNSKSCHFASLSVQLGGESTLVNPVSSQQLVPSAPVRYWATSPMATSVYPGATGTCETPVDGTTTLETSSNLWANPTSALRSSCSFSSNGCSGDDPSGMIMHRSLTLPFAPEPECPYMPMPVYMTTTAASRTPSQSSVGVRLLPSYAFPRWFTPPHRCSSKAKLLSKSNKDTLEDKSIETLRYTNGVNGLRNLEMERNVFAKTSQPVGGIFRNSTPAHMTGGTVPPVNVKECTELPEIRANGYHLARMNDRNRFIQTETRKSVDLPRISPIPQIAGL